MSRKEARAALQADYSRFQSQAPLLYDYMMSYGLTWPSLCAQWLPVEPYRTPGAITHQMLIGTYTEEGFANYMQLANVTLPDRSTADIAEQFMRHPVTTPQIQHASTKRGASVAAAAAAGASTAAMPAAAGEGGVAPVHFYTQGSLRLIHKVRSSQELHRIRPFGPSFMSDFARSSFMHSARDAEGQRGSHAQTRALAAAKGPENEVKIYDVGRNGVHPSSAMSSATLSSRTAPTTERKKSVAFISHSSSAKARELDESLLMLTGHTAGGWALDWNTAPGACSDGWLVSGDDEGGICVWNLQDSQAADLWHMPNVAQPSNSNSNVASSVGGLALPVVGAPARRLQAATATAAAAAPQRTSSAARGRGSGAPTLQARWHCRGGHTSSINDVAWLKADTASVFLTVGDDCRLKEWDCRLPSHDGAVRSVQVHNKKVNSVSASPFNTHLILTAGEDKVVRMWDRRNWRDLSPLHTYVGHGASVTQVTWAPFQHASRHSEHGGGVFASSSTDRRIFIWDSTRVDGCSLMDVAESGPPELLFVHAAHTDQVEDFSWHPHPSAPWLMASVGSVNENVLQVWEMFEGLHLSDDENAGGISEEQLLKELEPFSKLLQENPQQPVDLEQVVIQGTADEASGCISASAASAASSTVQRARRHLTKRMRTALDAAPFVAAAQFVVGYEKQLQEHLESLPSSKLEKATAVGSSATSASLRARANRRSMKENSDTASSRSTSDNESDSSSDVHVHVKLSAHATARRENAAKHQKQTSLKKAEAATPDTTPATAFTSRVRAPGDDCLFHELPPAWQQRLLKLQSAFIAIRKLPGRRPAHTERLYQAIGGITETMPDTAIRVTSAVDSTPAKRSRVNAGLSSSSDNSSSDSSESSDSSDDESLEPRGEAAVTVGEAGQATVKSVEGTVDSAAITPRKRPAVSLSSSSDVDLSSSTKRLRQGSNSRINPAKSAAVVAGSTTPDLPSAQRRYLLSLTNESFVSRSVLLGSYSLSFACIRDCGADLSDPAEIAAAKISVRLTKVVPPGMKRLRSELSSERTSDKVRRKAEKRKQQEAAAGRENAKLVKKDDLTSSPGQEEGEGTHDSKLQQQSMLPDVSTEGDDISAEQTPSAQIAADDVAASATSTATPLATMDIDERKEGPSVVSA